MKWRKGHGGDRWHRHEQWSARKNGIRYYVQPAFGTRWYVIADHANEGENSLWEAHGERDFATAEEAMAWAETWLQPVADKPELIAQHRRVNE